MVKCAALENSYFGIRVNAVAPGVTATKARVKKESLGLTYDQNQALLAEEEHDIPLVGEKMKINRPKEVAHCMLWLASDEASCVTGEIMTVDGG